MKTVECRFWALCGQIGAQLDEDLSMECLEKFAELVAEFGFADLDEWDEYVEKSPMPFSEVWA